MFDLFRFSLPRAVTEQLVERLEQLKQSPLTGATLAELSEFQRENEMTQGVYVVFHAEKAAYAGKADDLAERLGEHLWKLTGRQNIEEGSIGFKAVLLDENWSTSANESLLIHHYKAKEECRWNGSGFGPKDPGRIRDGGAPNWFDKNYPVRDDYPVTSISEKTTIGTALGAIKQQVPYLFRYDVPPAIAAKEISLIGVPQNARSLAVAITNALGDGWQLMLFPNGFTIYRQNRTYENGEQLVP